MSDIVKLINEKLNERGKLDCGDAFKISAKLKIPVKEVADAAHKADIRIDACELGQFGKLDKNSYSDKAKERLLNLTDEKGRVRCKEARAAAGGIGLAAVRGTIAKEGLEVIYCELGCFSEKSRPKMKIKTKIWIENGDGQLLFGKGKTEILEAIRKENSISGAADEIGMNYKKAWSHVQILQKYFKEPLVETHKGGGEQGGSFLTKEGEEYIAKYRQLQSEIEEFANRRFRELFLKK